jgi:hypothetical protein
MYQTHLQPRDSVASDRVSASVRRLRVRTPMEVRQGFTSHPLRGHTLGVRVARLLARLPAAAPVDAIGPVTGFPSTYEKSACPTNASCISERKYRTP